MPDAKPEENFVSYADRLAEVRVEAKKDLFKKQQEVEKFKQSPTEEVFAQALSRLFQSDDFKLYLAFENQELVDLVTNAYRQPDMGTFTTLSFGEQMAFNKGRHHQMVHLDAKRKQILKIYFNRLEKEVQLKQEE